jgi:hypothetical protein
MPWYPLNAAGLVYSADGDAAHVLGTCASYRSRDAWLTAAHCVPEGITVRIQPAVGPGQGERSFTEPVTVVRHESIDLAVLLLEPSPPNDFDDLAYKGVAEQLIDGGDFVGVGFPTEGVQNGPVPRLFKGHFMRYFGYQAPAGGYHYLAGEMSIPAPPGLSGGALAPSGEPERISAVVTTNVDSEVVLDRTEEVERGGALYRDSIVRHISYGIAALVIGGIDKWLDDVAVRPRPSA